MNELLLRYVCIIFVGESIKLARDKKSEEHEHERDYKVSGNWTIRRIRKSFDLSYQMYER